MNKRVNPESTIVVDELRLPVTEAQDTLRALRRGEVDALVVKGKGGEQVLALHDADQPYRVLVEKMQEGAATLDKEGAILYCNDRLASLLHTSTKRLIGTSIYRWVEPHNEAQLRALVGAGETQQAHDVTLCAASGDLMETRVTVTAVSLQGTPGVCLSVSNITALKRIERTLGLVQELAAILGNTQELDKALDVTLYKMGEAGGWSWGEAWLLRGDRVGLECRRRWDAETEDGDSVTSSEEQKNLVCLRGMGIVGRAWAENRPLWAQETWQDQEHKARRPSFKTGMAIPILAAGEVVAVIVFYLARPRAEDAELLRLTQTASAQLGPFILNKKTEEIGDFLAAIMRCSQDAIIGYDLNGVIMRWSASAQKLYGYTAAEIIGRPFSVLVPAEQAEEAATMLKQTAAGPVRIQAVHLNKQSRKVSVTLVLAPLRNSEITGTIAIVRPV